VEATREVVIVCHTPNGTGRNEFGGAKADATPHLASRKAQSQAPRKGRASLNSESRDRLAMSLCTGSG
jgi:hypothetical protein